MLITKAELPATIRPTTSLIVWLKTGRTAWNNTPHYQIAIVCLLTVGEAPALFLIQ
ncbi:hypothetical protein HMPREF3190_00144 [Umbribacter vaginalis]|nr:hypothetical protein HMPREF3190_00144 [Coriobacteriales bacterium DNF00809]